MKLKFNKKFKKTKLIKYGLFLSLTAVPVVVTACGSVDQNLINNSYLVNNTGSAFTSSFSLSQIANEALKTSGGFQWYFEGVVDEILYNWLVTLSQRNSEYKDLLDNEKEKINIEYEDSIKNYKDMYGNDWELKFQQEILDPNGGNKNAYIQKKLNSLARSTFTDKLFSTLYVSVYNTKTGNVDYNPTEENILNALKSTAKLTNATSDYKFKFDNRIDLLSSSNQRPDVEFASFQDFVFQKYAEYENPYVVDFVQWNYSTPSDPLGINSLYKTPENPDNGDSQNPDASGGGDQSQTTPTETTTNSNTVSLKRKISFYDDTATDGGDTSSSDTPSNAGTYAFPYFGNENATNTNEGTLSKFINFLSGSKFTDSNTKNEVTNYETDSDTGLKSIPLIISDNAVTSKLVKNSTLFSDEGSEFAAAVSYIYGKNTSQLTDINNSISHNIDLTSTDNKGLDLLSANFINTTNPYTNSTSTNQITPLQLSSDYLKNIINKDGALKDLANQNVYVIDNFIPGTVKIDSSNEYSNSLNKFIFFRSQDGVYAASLDGDSLISKGSNTSQKKLNSALVVLYRYLLNKYSNQNFTVDLSTELTNFFKSNVNWLIYQFALLSNHTGIDGTNFNQTMFNLNTLNSSEPDKTLASAVSNFSPTVGYYDKAKVAAEKMYDSKKTYNQNYGYSVYNNGLASNYNYQYAKSEQADYYSVNQNFLYENALLSSTSINPFEIDHTNSVNSNSNNKVTTSLYNTVLNALSSVTNSLVVQPAEYDKYSQYLYTTNSYVNYALTGVLSDSDFVSNLLKKPVFEKYLGDFYSTSNYTFNLKTNPFKSANSEDNTSVTDLQNYLKTALDNFFFMTNYQKETNSLFSYGTTSNTKTDVAKNDDVLTNIRKYSFDLWNEQNQSEYLIQVSNFNALYNLVSVVKYLMENNFANFLKYMKDTLLNENGFVVWENSSNTILNSSTTTLTSQSLIDQSKIYTNINNSIYGSYYGKAITNIGNNSSTTTPSTSALTNNIISDSFYQSTLNTNYLIATSSSTSGNNLLGFMGLQTYNNNSLSSDVVDALFTKTYNNNINLNGCLYSYGNNKEALIKIINNTQNFSDLSNLASNLDTLTNYNYSFATTIENNLLKLSEKKSELIKIVETLPDNYFTKFDGYVGEEISGENNSTTINAYSSTLSSATKYGTLAYQLNYDDFASFASLQKALGAKENDQNSYKFANEIICNLLVQFASKNTETFLAQIINKNRFEVYDIRAYNAFSQNGIIWISNWKNINSNTNSDA